MHDCEYLNLPRRVSLVKKARAGEGLQVNSKEKDRERDGDEFESAVGMGAAWWVCTWDVSWAQREELVRAIPPLSFF